jgi:hypothetical protein
MMTPIRDAFHDADAPVTVATFPNPYEAAMARAALESQGVKSVVGADHGQYLSAASWVQLQVARRDTDLAAMFLEDGPWHPSKNTLDTPDDMRALRLSRRFRLARWFLYAQVGFAAWSTLPLPIFLVPLCLALWSRSDPRRAFGLAFGVQAVVAFVSISTMGTVGLMNLIPLLALHVAWRSAEPTPPEQLVASPIPASPAIGIGEAWKAGAAGREPPERPIWAVPVLRVGIFALGALWILWLLTLS